MKVAYQVTFNNSEGEFSKFSCYHLMRKALQSQSIRLVYVERLYDFFTVFLENKIKSFIQQRTKFRYETCMSQCELIFLGCCWNGKYG